MKAEKNILQALMKAAPRNDEELARAKRAIARKFGVGMVTNNWLLKIYREAIAQQKIEKTPWLELVLIKRPVRTLSGVAPLTVATKPFPCPGRCIYCPTDVRMPKSYLVSQPAAARALRHKFHPFDQVHGRLEMYYANGHVPEKVDLRILGGTWSSYPKNYQTWFVKELYRGLNEYKIRPRKLSGRNKSKTRNSKFKTLQLLQKQNETATHRCIGMAIETRPDWVTMDEIKRFRRFGVTKVELGVQHLDKTVQDLTKRDHYKEDVVTATKLLRDAGFKVVYHLMPNLPGSTPEMDVAVFKEIFSDDGLKPDQLKIYPCVVLKQAYLYKWYQAGRFKTYNDATLIDILAQMKRVVPPYVRIERIYRDIPAPDIIAGSKNINMRELVQKEMKRRGWKCKCIRCREVKDKLTPNHVGFRVLRTPRGTEQNSKLFTQKYNASQGTEHFISFESPDRTILYAFTRLRFPSEDIKNQLPPLRNTAIIRELHTYGQLAPITTNYSLPTTHYSQHKGLGKRLLEEAEKIAKSRGYDTIAVISGVGVRGYYHKLGYKLENEYGYMIKNLSA